MTRVQRPAPLGISPSVFERPTELSSRCREVESPERSADLEIVGTISDDCRYSVGRCEFHFRKSRAARTSGEWRRGKKRPVSDAHRRLCVTRREDAKVALNYLNRCTPDAGRNGNTQFRAGNSLCTRHAARRLLASLTILPIASMFSRKARFPSFSNFLTYKARADVRRGNYSDS